MSTDKPLTEAELMTRVRERFPMRKGWATFSGIRNHRGFDPPKGQKTRTLDGMSVGVWQSLKGEVLGFECKSTRGDFLREIADPSKSDAFYPHCNRFWLVIGEPSVCSPDEVPMGWGLLVPRGRTLVEKVRAKRKKTEGIPQGIVLSLLFSCCEGEEDKLRAARKDERVKVCEEYESGQAIESKLRGLKSKAERLQRELGWANDRVKTAEEDRDALRKALQELAATPQISAPDIIRAHELDKRLRRWDGGVREIESLLRSLDRAKTTLRLVVNAISGEEVSA